MFSGASQDCRKFNFVQSFDLDRLLNYLALFVINLSLAQLLDNSLANGAFAARSATSNT